MRHYEIAPSFPLLSPNYAHSYGTQKEAEESRQLLGKRLHIVSPDQQSPVTVHTRCLVH